MEKPLTPPRSALAVRGRATLAWAAVLFLLAQAGLNFALFRTWPLRDPEYGRRLVALRQRQAERGAGRPLVLLLGSSRVGMNLRPGLLEVNRPDADGPTVFNFGLCRAGPMMELHCLRRLLGDGVRPDLVLAELHYSLFCWRVGEHQAIAPERLRWSDVQTLAPEFERPGRLQRQWLRDHVVPWHGLNSHLLAQWAPFLLAPDARRKADEWAVDDWGWLGLPFFREDNPLLPLSTRRESLDNHAPGFVTAATGFPVSDHTRRMLADLADLCRHEGVRLAFVLMPDGFLPRYPPAADRHLDREYAQISRDCGAPVIDLRDGASVDDFVDGVHLTDGGAARFTRVFEDEVLPHIVGQPLDQRWPVGEVRPTAEARRRLAEREAGVRAAYEPGTK